MRNINLCLFIYRASSHCKYDGQKTCCVTHCCGLCSFVFCLRTCPNPVLYKDEPSHKTKRAKPIHQWTHQFHHSLSALGKKNRLFARCNKNNKRQLKKHRFGKMSTDRKN